jgi:hypothetical protein
MPPSAGSAEPSVTPARPKMPAITPGVAVIKILPDTPRNLSFQIAEITSAVQLVSFFRTCFARSSFISWYLSTGCATSVFGLRFFKSAFDPIDV